MLYPYNPISKYFSDLMKSTIGYSKCSIKVLFILIFLIIK